MQGTQGLDRVPDVVFLAQRHAARGHQQVVVRRRPVQGVADGRRLVGQDAQVGHPAAQAFQQGHDSITVGIKNTALGGIPARIADLVTGGKDRRAQPGADRQFRFSHRSRQPDILGTKAMTRMQHDPAFLHVFTPEAAVGAPLEAGGQDHAAAVDFTVLEHEDGVRAATVFLVWLPTGHDGAGENLQGLAPPGRAVQGMAGGDAAGHQQPGFPIRVQVIEIDRIAVNRRIVMGRHVPGRGQVLGQDTARRPAQGYGLHAGDRFEPPGQVIQRRVQGRQFPAGGKAVILKLRHRPLSLLPVPAHKNR